MSGSADFHGLSAIRLRALDGASAIVTLHGAHLVSWIPAGGRERMFVSERSAFAADRPIRGGIPVVFPQFSSRGPLAHHGFARTQGWRLMNQRAEDGAATVTFALENSIETRRAWPHSFALELTVKIGGTRLDTELLVRNTGEGAFSFTSALHTYLAVSATTARLQGLRGVRYVEGGAAGTDANELVTAANPIDRVYIDAPREIRLSDSGELMTITQRGFRDTVVWNPGPRIAAAREDMHPMDYLKMLCVEAAAVEAPIVLAAGGKWQGGQCLQLGA